MSLTEAKIRHYHQLRRLAKDQAGKPEGQTAAKIANKLLAKYPELERTREPRAASGAARSTGANQSGGPSFKDLLRDIAAQNGAQEAADLLDGVEQLFPGLIDEGLHNFARSLFGRSAKDIFGGRKR